MKKLRALLVEDSPEDAELLTMELRRAGYDLETIRVDNAAALDKALSQEWDIVFADYSMPGFGGLDALRQIQAKGLDMPFIIVSGTIGEDLAVSAMRAGIQDYLLKDRLARLPSVVERELREAKGKRERRRLELQLQQSQKMEAIGRLAGGIAHDFNNLLTAIVGYTDLLIDRHRGDADLKELEEIKKAGLRAAKLTAQLLAFSRKAVVLPRVLQINDIVQDISTMLQRLIGENVRMATHLAPELGSIRADPDQLQQVMVNLVVNARDAMLNGGTITVETNNVVLGEDYVRNLEDVKAGNFVMLAVSDSGVGMTPEVKARLFEPFFTTKEKGKGTGLGLATVYGVVRQSGGHISVYSEPGRGSAFKVYFPRIDSPAEKSTPVPAISPLRAGTETLLLVEDEALVRKLAREVLKRQGYVILEAENGQQALEVQRQHGGTIHLMVSDMVMPVMGGQELSEKMKQLRPQMKVLFISGYTEHAIGNQGVLPAGQAFLPKPFKPRDLAAKVRELLDG